MKSNLKRDVIIGLTGLTLTLSVPVGAQAEVGPLHLSNDVASLQSLPASPLKDGLMQLDDSVRAQVIRKINQRKIPTQDVNSLHVDEEGMLYYVDKPPQRFTTTPLSIEKALSSTRTRPVLSRAETFALASKPGSKNTFYLDFNGHNIHSSSIWSKRHNNGIALKATPYDTDGNPDTFSRKELGDIAEIWRQVAEDFAPFNVNVTTKEPTKTWISPRFPKYGHRVGHALITNNYDKNGYAMPGGDNGTAYIGVWSPFAGDTPPAPPALIYIGVHRGNIADLSDTVSHELGHLIGLYHHGTSVKEYYRGHGSWGPIMGSPVGRAQTQWSDGSYYDANNTSQDDAATLRGMLGSAKSDHASKQFMRATPLTVAADGKISSTNLKKKRGGENRGIISRSEQVDLFKVYARQGRFRLEAKGHRSIDEPSRGGNLNIRLSLYDRNGRLIQTNKNNAGAVTIDKVLDWGLYYVAVEGIGSPDSGSYGSMGHYFLSGKLENGPANPASFPRPKIKAFDDHIKVYNPNLPGSKTAHNLLVNDHGKKLKIKGVSAADHGTVTLEASGKVKYTPNPSFTGPDKFTYTVQDKEGRTSKATVHIEVLLFSIFG